MRLTDQYQSEEEQGAYFAFITLTHNHTVSYRDAFQPFIYLIDSFQFLANSITLF